MRPRKRRIVDFEHSARQFRPFCPEGEISEEVILKIDELEAMRLSFLENLSQGEAAVLMEIHQSTFQRALRKSLEKVTEALVYGKAIRIEGGDYRMPRRDGTGPAGQGPVGGGRSGTDPTGQGPVGGGRSGTDPAGQGPVGGGRSGTDPAAQGPIGSGRSRGQGRGRGGRFGGPEGNCICPACGHETPHTPGVSCSQAKCEKCGSPMVRK